MNLPDTPAGRQLSWFLSCLAKGLMDQDDVTRHFSPAFLGAVPSERVRAALESFADSMNPVVVEQWEAASDREVVARLKGAAGEGRARISVEPQDPHLITGLLIRRIERNSENPPVPWTDIENGPAPAITTSLPDELNGRVTAMLEEARSTMRLPGLAAAIVQGGDPKYLAALGWASLQARSPVALDTVFPIASISKTMTAIGVMKLVEEGVIALEDPVNEHLKDLRIETRDGASPVTVFHLLTHTAGIIKEQSPRDIEIPDGAEPPKIADLYGGVVVAELPPGERVAYSNDGYMALGKLIEDVSGIDFAEYMAERVFRPLEMTSTDYRDLDHLRPHFAEGYERDLDDFMPVSGRSYYRRLVRPQGSVRSTIIEMSRYVMALTHRPTLERSGILLPETLRKMFSAQAVWEGGGRRQGLGFVLPRLDGEEVAWHNGGHPGFKSSMWLLPQRELGVVVLTNSFIEDFEGLPRRIVKLLLAGLQTVA